MNSRRYIPEETQTTVLTRSGRRCCMCFGLQADSSIRKGQIAHVDQNSANNDVNNLVFLCFDHHDEYDSKTSQSKGLLAAEVVTYREKLFDWISSSSVEERVADFIDFDKEEIDKVDEVIERYRSLSGKGLSDLKDQIFGRIKRYIACNREVEQAFENIPFDEFEPDTIDRWAIEARIKRAHEIPFSVYGIVSEELVDDEWPAFIDPLLIEWCYGRASNSDCRYFFQELDVTYDLDPFYFLYGLPAGELSGMSMRYLSSFVYEFGTRNRP